MLRIWILNVGHGDSIVLEYDGPSGKCFGVIDSNRELRDSEPPALQKVRERGGQKLSFVLLTHPHADHFAGLHTILSIFPVHTFYSYPMHRDTARLKKAGEKYLAAAESSGSETIKSHALEFVSLIVLAHKRVKSGEMEWIDLEGPTNRVRPPGFEGVNINALLPFRKVKGEYYNALDKDKPDALQSLKQNELSVALDIEYAQHRIALCGDATRTAWGDHERELQKHSERLAFTVTKLPHHGSATDCDERVLNYLYDSRSVAQKRIALVSADGSRHHPSPVVLQSLRDRSVLPYCTNLAPVCGNNIRHVLTSPDISPELVKLLNVSGATAKTNHRQPCQGNICVEISATGELAIQRQYNHPCAFRGDFDFLTSSSTQQ